jgi:hypothetical protein
MALCRNQSISALMVRREKKKLQIDKSGVQSFAFLDYFFLVKKLFQREIIFV